MSYELIKTCGKAKRGRFKTARGIIETPVFMNVGTQAAIKGAVSSLDLREINCQVELSNTYHLRERPGDELIKKLGGLHKFMNWDGPILTDSGGFQIFSLQTSVKEEGVTFRSHIDGRKIFIGPEESVQIQSNLGSDIAMTFDECAPYPADRAYIAESVERTLRWAVRCKNKLTELNKLDSVINRSQVMFGINQGGVFKDLRIENAKRTVELDFPGNAVGGLAVGEEKELTRYILDVVTDCLPVDKPVYLMGVGTERDILECVSLGADFFDCVLPARNGRHGHVFTRRGKLNIMNQKYADDDRPIDETCGCPACKNFSRAYIRHLFKAKEALSMRLCVLHNLYYYNNFMKEIRDAIEAGDFFTYKKRRLQELI
jgi:queuine tRNA-ribosyltransferase